MATPRLYSMHCGKNALLTVSLFWDCGRFWSFRLLCCRLAKKFHPGRSPPPCYAPFPGTSVPVLSFLPFATPLSGTLPPFNNADPQNEDECTPAAKMQAVPMPRTNATDTSRRWNLATSPYCDGINYMCKSAKTRWITSLT